MVSPIEGWFYQLEKRGFLERNLKLERGSDRTYTLRTPFTVLVPANVVRKLKEKYTKDREMGGILAAAPVVAGGRRILKVDRVKFLKNYSKNPEGEYRANEQWIRYLDSCLSGRWYKRRRIPIMFHSHPRVHPKHSEHAMSLFEMVTSEGDQNFDPLGIRYAKLRKTLYFPLALLVVTQDEEAFLGIFGGHVAPKEFDSYMAKILFEDTGRMAKDTLQWGFEEGASGWRKAGAALLVGLEAFMAISKPLSIMTRNPETIAIINDRIIELQKNRDVKNYFDIQREGSMEIEIPKMEEEF